MKPMKRLALITVTLASFTAQAELQTRTVDYQVDGNTHTGYLAWEDDVDGERPGVLVVHEWWGHNEFARDQAEKLAEAGYTAFALDMYGSGKVADHPDTAKKFMQQAMSDTQRLETRFRAAMTLLKNHDTVDATRIAAQGYCFGGAVVLNMARLGLDLDGVVSYHGSLGSDITAEPGQIKAKVQAYTGGADNFVPAEQVGAFVQEMQAAGADVMLKSYAGVTHSFTNPEADTYAERFDMPLAYDQAAAEDAWQGTLGFYESIFAQ